MKIIIVLVLLCALGACAIEFSPNSCVVIGESGPAQCDHELPPVDDTYTVIDENRLLFTNIDDAIANCPYSPALIEFSGTVYSRGNVSHGKNPDLVIRGVRDDYDQPATVVGLTGLRVADMNAVIKMENFVAEGCHTQESLFSGSLVLHGCLIERSFIIDNVAFNRYDGPHVICQISYHGNSYAEISYSAFFDIPQLAIKLVDANVYNIHDNYFSNCGSENTAVVYLGLRNNTDPQSSAFFNNRISNDGNEKMYG